MPKVDFEYIDNGVIYKAVRRLDDGRWVNRISTWISAACDERTQRRARGSRSGGLGFTVPVDDTHSRNIMVFKARPGMNMFAADAQGSNRTTGMAQMKRWQDMTVEERQDNPNDYEAQVGQGPISLHSEEHLATSDRGIAMQRRMH